MQVYVGNALRPAAMIGRALPIHATLLSGSKGVQKDLLSDTVPKYDDLINFDHVCTYVSWEMLRGI
jgi:hypothetical protein